MKPPAEGPTATGAGMAERPLSGTESVSIIEGSFFARNHSGGNVTACSTWLPDLPRLPSFALWLNFSLYFVLLLLVLALCTRSYVWHSMRCSPRCLAKSTLMLAFAVNRVAWATLLIGVMIHAEMTHPGDHHAFDELSERFAFFSNKVGSCVFYMLTALLLTQVADALVTGWKSSRRLWALCRLIVFLLVLVVRQLASILRPLCRPAHAALSSTLLARSPAR